jgi:hypothetical protein
MCASARRFGAFEHDQRQEPRADDLKTVPVEAEPALDIGIDVPSAPGERRRQHADRMAAPPEALDHVAAHALVAPTAAGGQRLMRIRIRIAKWSGS